MLKSKEEFAKSWSCPPIPRLLCKAVSGVHTTPSSATKGVTQTNLLISLSSAAQPCGKVNVTQKQPRETGCGLLALLAKETCYLFCAA